MQEYLIKIGTDELLENIRKIIREEICSANKSYKVPVTQDELVPLDRVLEATHISAATFSRLRKRYNVPVYHAGRRILFKIPEVIEALQAKNYLRSR